MLTIQYDEIIGSVAFVLWALFLFTAALHRSSSQESGGSASVAWLLAFSSIPLTALVGPLGFAVIALWGRDELVFVRENEKRKGNEKTK